MKAISLTQPWATLVAIGAKRIETRSWSTTYRGLTAIHASKAFPKACRNLCAEEPFYSILQAYGERWAATHRSLKAVVEDPLMPTGAIVSVARLVEIVLTGDMRNHIGRGGQIFLGRLGTWNLTAQEVAFGDYSPGRFAWCLADVLRLPEPIPCKGALGLWTVPPDIARQLADVTAP